jgi:5-methyltetrahydropteroyltriglutamate--homocysteine methyltransferase
LRPAHLLALQDASTEERRAAEDKAIADAIALQDRIGLKLATDGEFRRKSYHTYFYRQLGDISLEPPPAHERKSGSASQPQAVIRSRLCWTKPIHVGDFALIRSLTNAVPKITIPGPCALHFRGGDGAVTAHAYRDVDAFWDDTVTAFRNELAALAEAGCTYVQIDETAFAKFGDPDVQAALAARGDRWDTLIDTYIDITNRVLDGLPPQLNVGMHLCRGNRAGQWHAQGSYDAVAERLFNRLAIRFFFLEYDTPRAGDFTPLRFVPPRKSVILGLVSTKASVIESRDEIKRRVDDASRYVDLDRLGISPQCGFASVAEGNPVTREAQEAKLRLVVDVARDIWGSA